MRTLQAVIILSLWVMLVPAQTPSQPRRADVRISEPATLEVWNRQIVTLRAAVGETSPRTRVENARRRIEDLPDAALFDGVQAAPGSLGELQGLFLSVGPQIIAGILPEDVDPESGQTLEQVGRAAADRLREVLQARADQRRLPVLIRGIGFATGATILFWLFVWGLARLYSRVTLLIEERARILPRKIFNFDLHRRIGILEQIFLKLITLVVILVGAHFWLTFVLVQFPYTRPWGERVGGYVGALAYTLGLSAMQAMPGLFTVVVILILTRIVTRSVDSVFLKIERGQTTVAWLAPDTVPATRKLVTTLIWIFAITVAYPYVPGSHTDAFKGVSVFVGLMISLGSAGLVNQVMSGLVIIYARAFKPGDYVRVNETEGTVSHVGLLSTKIATVWNEEITVPNAVMVSNLITNYSRLAALQGPVANTLVTIGYDAPWRQVHSLLILAAERTPGLRKEPPPWVLQRALADYYVEYQLCVILERAEDRIPTLSELHKRIQDAFNEYDVQIMSPHFVLQPKEKVTVDRSKWHPPPASEAAD